MTVFEDGKEQARQLAVVAPVGGLWL